MPAWLIPLLPILIRLAEALAVGVIAAGGVSQLPGGDAHAALNAGVGAFLGKLLPAQIIQSVARGKNGAT